MSGVLLDTHVLIWLLTGDSRLGRQPLALINQAAALNAVFVSAITPWEIAMLVSKGRLRLDKDVGEWIQIALALPGIRLEPLTAEISVASTRLPDGINPDPADRIIVSTARHLGVPLITADMNLIQYGSLGHVKLMPV